VGPGVRTNRPAPQPAVDRRAPQRPVDRRGEEQEWSGYRGGWPAEERQAEQRQEPRPIRKGRWIAVAAVLAVLATGGGAAVGARNRPAAPAWQSAQAVGAALPVLASLGGDAPQPSTAGLSAVLGPLLSDSGLGGHVTASVIDVATGQQLYNRDGAGAATPASTAKLVTAAAVLQARGPAYRIPTRVVAGANPGEVVLVGGGDPTLAAGVNTSYPGAARVDLLAGKVAKALNGQPATRVTVDVSAYSGPTYSPGWYAADARSGVISNITALMTDGARKDPRKVKDPSARQSQPDLAAGQTFAAALGLPASVVSFATAPAGAKMLGEVLSPPVSRMVEMMLQESDNVVAEAMARQVALAKGKPGSFEGGAQAAHEMLAAIGVPTAGLVLADGSGLSHLDRVSAQLLTAILAKAASPDFPQLRSILTGLPVAAYSGTLSDRYTNPSAGGTGAGTVRAKTGTLSNVDTLAGLAVDANGRLLAFSLLADATGNSGSARAALDRVAAAVASCGCS
jgi:serine-type D-Ala-D-Ala carboxypeptidase/endopeptidase (penicillin-binding protein 4)